MSKPARGFYVESVEFNVPPVGQLPDMRFTIVKGRDGWFYTVVGSRPVVVDTVLDELQRLTKARGEELVGVAQYIFEVAAKRKPNIGVRKLSEGGGK